MATPRSEQFIPGALPGQAAIASPSSQLFQAIGGVGRQIQQKGQEMIDLEEREAEERKRQEDKLAAREFTNEIRLTQQKFNTDMDNAKSDEEIDEIASARSAYLQDFLNSRENMSDELKEELQLEADFQSSASEEMARAAKNNRLKKRQLSAAESSVGIAVMDGDKEALSDAVDAMDEAGAFDSPEHKQEFMRNQEMRIDRAQSAQVVEQSNIRIAGMSEANNLDGLKAESEAADAGEGIYGEMDENALANAKNKIFKAQNEILYKQNRVYGEFLDDLGTTGVINDLEYQEAVRQNLLTDEMQNELLRAAPSAKQRIQNINRLKEDKQTVSYKTISAEIDSDYLEKFVKGDNIGINIKTFDKMIERIDNQPDLSPLAKNTLKSKMVIATSQAIFESDALWGAEFDDEWDGVTDQDRRILMQWGTEYARLLKDLSDTNLTIFRKDPDTGQIQFAEDALSATDFFKNVMIGLGKEAAAGGNYRQSAQDALQQMRFNVQRAKVKNSLIE